MRANQRRGGPLALIEELEPRVLFSAGLDVALIDSQLQDSELLSKACAAAEAVVVYDSTQESAADVLLRATLIAAQHGEQIESLSILSHGSPGEFTLGNETISLENLELTTDDWHLLADSMVEGGNIYLFGCGVGGTEQGAALVDKLAEITGRDVFASDDVTGAGGDWDLEVASKGDEAERSAGLDTPLDAQLLQSYTGTLNIAPVVNNQNFTIAENSANGSAVGTVVASDPDQATSWFSSSWTHRKAITVDSSLVPADQTDFPLLISLPSDAQLATGGAQADADDIVFTASDGVTQLDHEIERFVSATGELVAWVRIPALSASADTQIYMYYGNAVATNQQNPTAVWDSDYVSVWHLGNGDSTAPGFYQTSTSASTDLTLRDLNFNVTAVATQIGRGLDLSSNDADYLSDGTSVEAQNMTSGTMEAWFRHTGQEGVASVLLERYDDANNYGVLYFDADGTLAYRSLVGGVAVTNPLDTNASVADGLWHHASVTWDGSEARIRIDYDAVTVAEAGDETATFANPTLSRLASDSGGVLDYDGYLDEVRFSSVARSASWQQTQYNNQSNPGAFISLGGQEARFAFSITAGNASGAFAIDAETGQITVANSAALDYEAASAFVLTVQVADSGNPVLTDTAAITVNLTDVNEFAPAVLGATFQIAENTANGTVVGSVSASDADTAQTLSYSITAGNGAGAFAINASTGQISVANSSLLDREATAAYSLTVTVQDSGSPAQTGTAQIDINLTDVNEFAPIASNSTFNISASSADGTHVGFVNATDGDTSQPLTYTITGGNPTGIFGIEAATGHIFVADGSQLDAVSGPQHVLSVSVTDGVSSDPATITINVSPNQAPVVADQSFSVLENSANGTVVGSVPSSDPDGSAAPWANSAWAHRRPLTIDHTRVAGNLSNFPVLISFASNPKLAAGGGRADGLDIFFTAADGVTKLDHEIEYYQSATGQLTAWVRIPALSASADTAIYMYYGNAAAADQQNAAGVWDAGFESVHHLSTLQDSTSHNHDLTALGNATVGSAQQISGGAVFDGSGDGFTMGDVNALDGIQKLTVSAWVKMDTLAEAMDVVSKTSAGASKGWWVGSSATLFGDGGGKDDQGSVWGDLGGISTAGAWSTNNNLAAGRLHHWTAVYDGTQSKVSFYIDGVLQGTGYGSQGIDAQTPANNTGAVQFGRGDTGGGALALQDLDGTLDEVRISTTARSAAWIRTEYLNEQNPQSFVTLGVEDTLLNYSITGGNAAGAFAINPVTGQITVANSAQLNHEATSSYSLTVTVTDAGNPPLSSLATITIDCADVNEFTPVVQNASFSVLENTANGTSVGSVTATDADTSQTLTYAITAGNPSGIFAINASTGVITVANSALLDHEAAAVHTLTVTARDNLAPLRTGTGTITINVGDVNEFTPVVQNSTFSVAENSANATPVGTVVASDADTSQSLTYAITGGNPTGIFAINAATGQITVADGTQLDHEAIAQYVLTVSVQDDLAPQRSAAGTITINVTDVNEFTPVAADVTYSVDENTANGTAIGTVFANDDDTSQTLTYTITGGNPSGIFAINASTGVVSVANSALLDHEAAAVHVLTVTVQDNGTPQRSTSAAVTINVNDVNEFNPVVPNTTLNVLENSANGTAVGSVPASDADTSQTLTYSITGGNPTGIFAIDPATGQITVADGSQLDHEATAAYSLTVTAIDDLAPQRSGSGTITINVNDVNEFTPVAADATFNVDENTANGTPVGTVAASDADTSQTLTYTITAGNPSGIFAINASTGVITVANSALLDHEAAAVHALTVTVQDNLAPVRSTSAAITINVNDVNEFNPVVPNTTLNVLENSANGTAVGSVPASDADTSQTLTYSITGGNPTGIFAIDPATGQITVADGSQLDHEATAAYSLTVTAIDDLAPQRSGSGIITINVNDVNEFNPVAADATFNVDENTANGTPVGTVAASDADTSQTLTYTISAGNPSGIFAINASTGVITVANSALLDHEAAALHALTVTVQDNLAPVRSTTAAITIVVNDVNEFNPVVANASFNVLENSATGTSVGTVVASDADTSQTLTYAIAAGDPTGVFAIDPATGQITVADGSQLDHEATAAYSLTVTVTDDLAPQRTSSATISISVDDVNEFDPVVADATFGVDENTANGTPIGVVVASDADTSQTLSYAITAGDPTGIFAIDPSTGAISIADSAQLDHEAAAVHVLTVTVTDDLLPFRSSSATITVNVNDVNEFDPVVQSATLNVLENSANGSAVGTVLASDADTSQTLSYAITGGDPTGIFAIDPSTGAISVADGSQLDHEATPVYVLTVTVTDDLMPLRSGSAAITINVNDVNEFDPVVQSAVLSVLENSPNGSAVGTVLASDADTSQTLSYAITGGDPTGVFAIDAATGAITVANSAQLNHEAVARYVLQVTVTDDLAPLRSGTAAITIDVGDVNEFRPLAPNVLFTVDRTQRSGVVLGQVPGTDADTSQTISYAITGGNSSGLFAIDAATGAISLATGASFPGLGQHVLTITLRDSGNPQFSSKAVVTIDVVDLSAGTPGNPKPAEPVPGVDPLLEPLPPELPKKAAPLLRAPEPEFEAPVHEFTLFEFDLEHAKLPSLLDALNEAAAPSSTPPPEVRVNVKRTQAEAVAIEPAFWEGLNRVHQDMDREVPVTFWLADLRSIALVVAAGSVQWLLRGSSLLSTLLMWLPAWMGFDPLPILDARKRDGEEEDQFELWQEGTELEDLFEPEAASGPSESEKEAEKRNLYA